MIKSGSDQPGQGLDISPCFDYGMSSSESPGRYLLTVSRPGGYTSLIQGVLF